MTFRVEPAALRTCASQLSDAQRVAKAAGNYVKQYGRFSFLESGLIGWVAPETRTSRPFGSTSDRSEAS